MFLWFLLLAKERGESWKSREADDGTGYGFHFFLGCDLRGDGVRSGEGGEKINQKESWQLGSEKKEKIS